jgi:hypothetical protein
MVRCARSDVLVGLPHARPTTNRALRQEPSSIHREHDQQVHTGTRPLQRTTPAYLIPRVRLKHRTVETARGGRNSVLRLGEAEQILASSVRRTSNRQHYGYQLPTCARQYRGQRHLDWATTTRALFPAPAHSAPGIPSARGLDAAPRRPSETSPNVSKLCRKRVWPGPSQR